MPHLLAGWAPEEREAAAEALAHFLASLEAPDPAESTPEANPHEIEEGERLYHTVGCVACHAPFEPAGTLHQVSGEGFYPERIQVQPPRVPSVPIADQSLKTTLEPLADFLADPLRLRPAGRMPPMRLSNAEARSIAAYLLEQGTDLMAPESINPDAEKITRGHALFRELGCGYCHRLEEEETAAAPLPRLEELDPGRPGGCLDPSPRKGVPNYELDPDQRAALGEALSGLKGEVSRLDPEAEVRRHLEIYNCFACHRRGEQGGPEPGRAAYFLPVEELDMGNEGRLPPPLTEVGRKLTPPWLRKVLEGSGMVRPYLMVRMPDYGTAAETLADALIRADEDLQLPATDVSGTLHHHRNRYGRRLMGADGLNCINCHGLRGHPSTGMPALDLADTLERLQPDWFKRYLLDPDSSRPGTLMPTFFEGGKGTLTEVLEGDADKQIEAILTYLKELDQTRLPVGMEPNEFFELVPGDRPILLRTFMEGVGTHAIAVGFPQGIHFAFDALEVRSKLLWRGRFLNAESTWSNRFSPFVHPLSEDLAKLPDAMPLASLKDGLSPWPDRKGKEAGFRMGGFRVSPSGEPTFLYSFRGIAVEERLMPSQESAWFRRTVELTGDGESVWFLAARAPKIETQGAGRYSAAGLKVRLREPEVSMAVLRRSGGADELLLPIRFREGRARVQQEISW
jgi:mono/diheme cytochrome c family protein